MAPKPASLLTFSLAELERFTKEGVYASNGGCLDGRVGFEGSTSRGRRT